MLGLLPCSVGSVYCFSYLAQNSVYLSLNSAILPCSARTVYLVVLGRFIVYHLVRLVPFFCTDSALQGKIVLFCAVYYTPGYYYLIAARPECLTVCCVNIGTDVKQWPDCSCIPMCVGARLPICTNERKEFKYRPACRRVSTCISERLTVCCINVE